MGKFFHKLKRTLRLLLLLALLVLGLYTFRDRLPAVFGLEKAPELPAELTLMPAGQLAPPAVEIPAYTGSSFTELGGNVPAFGREALSYRECYARYSELDSLGRAGAALACIGWEVMPRTERGPIGDLRPSGFRNARYDDLIEDHYLYNRCHIIGYQLSGDNGDIHNLFTGTRYLNVEGMLPFENQVAAYLRESGKHVLYRATPLYQGRELVARGIELEAWSLEDQGQSVCFHVFVHNVQPGVIIDYATGESSRAPE